METIGAPRNAPKRRGPLMPRKIFPAEEKTIRFSVEMPESLVEKLQAVADKEGRSRNNVIMHFLQWAHDEYEAEVRDQKHRK